MRTEVRRIWKAHSMPGELERLLVRLEADTAQLRRAMNDAGKNVEDYERKTERSLKKTEDRFKSFGQSITATLSKVGIALSAGLVIKSSLDALEQAGELKILADAAGLTAEKFQELQFAFTSAGVSQADFGRAVTTLARNVAELRNNTGGFYEFLRTSLPTVEAQIRGAQSTEEAFNIVAEAVRRLDTEQGKALLTQRAFGENGIRFTSVLKGGSAALAESAERARQLGIITSNESSAGLEELNKKYKEAMATLDAYWKRAIVGVKEFHDEMDKVARTNFALSNPTKAPVEDLAISIAEAERRMKDLRDKIADYSGNSEMWNQFFTWIRWYRIELADLEKTYAVLIKRRNEFLATQPIGDFKTEVKPADELKMQQKKDFTGEDALASLIRQRADLENEIFLSVHLGMEKELEDFKRLYEERKITVGQYEDAITEIARVTSAKRIAEVKRETDAIAAQLAPFRSVIETTLSQPLDDAFSGNMQSMQSYLASLAQGLAKATQQALILKPLMDYIQNGIAGPNGPGSFLNALGLKAFGQSQQTGGFGSGFNETLSGAGGWETIVSAFGGGRAVGGPMIPGMAYQTHKDELIVPNTSATVFNARDTRRLLEGGSGAANVSYNIDARGADISVAERVEAAIAKAQRSRTDPVTEVARNQHRFPTRKV